MIQLRRNFNVEPIERTSTSKTMIEAEFRKNIVGPYDKTESDTLLGTALSSFGISDDLLFKNTAERLRSKLKGNDIDWTLQMTWNH